MVIPSMYLQMFLSQSFLVLDTDSFWSSSGVACSSCSCMEAQPNWVFNFIEISLCNVTPRPGDRPHSWTRSPLRVPSNSNTSMILWYFDSHPGLPLSTLKSRLPWAAHSCFLSFFILLNYLWSCLTARCRFIFKWHLFFSPPVSCAMTTLYIKHTRQLSCT